MPFFILFSSNHPVSRHVTRKILRSHWLASPFCKQRWLQSILCCLLLHHQLHRLRQLCHLLLLSRKLKDNWDCEHGRTNLIAGLMRACGAWPYCPLLMSVATFSVIIVPPFFRMIMNSRWGTHWCVENPHESCTCTMSITGGDCHSNGYQAWELVDRAGLSIWPVFRHISQAAGEVLRPPLASALEVPAAQCGKQSSCERSKSRPRNAGNRAAVNDLHYPASMNCQAAAVNMSDQQVKTAHLSYYELAYAHIT